MPESQMLAARTEPDSPSRPAFVWPRQGEWTYEDWLRLPEDDGWRYEVIRGRLYLSPAPRSRHQIIASHLGYALQRHVRERDLGLVLYAPLDVFLPGETTPVEPDIVVVLADQREIVVDRGIESAPALLVEILSPSTRWQDLEVKRPLYAERGVGELWIVDPERGEILVHEPDGEGGWRQTGRYGAGQVARSERLTGFAVAVDAVMAG